MIKTGRFEKTPEVVCASNWNGDDRTLCGDAFDKWGDEWLEDPISQRVTCVDCHKIVRHCKMVRLSWKADVKQRDR